jgi:hypothetical protein
MSWKLALATATGLSVFSFNVQAFPLLPFQTCRDASCWWLWKG